MIFNIHFLVHSDDPVYLAMIDSAHRRIQSGEPISIIDKLALDRMAAEAIQSIVNNDALSSSCS